MWLEGTVFLYLMSLVFTESHDIELIGKVHTSYLDKYENYANVILLHFDVPNDVSFAAFKFVSEEANLSIFSCKAQDVTLYMKEGAPPVINPDGSKFPDKMLNTSRSHTYSLNFKSDKEVQYINITSPIPGRYYIVTFRSWTDPKEEGITQQGLTPQCYTFVDAGLYVKREKIVDIIIPNVDFNLALNSSRIIKYYIPDFIDHAVLYVKEIVGENKVDYLRIQTQSWNAPGLNNSESFIVKDSDVPYYSQFFTQQEAWHYIKFEALDENGTEANANITFRMIFFSPIIQNKAADSLWNTSSSVASKTSRTESLTGIVHYKQFDLIRESSTDNFIFSFDLPPTNNNTVPLFLNLTVSETTVLKYDLKGSDYGGTIQFILAFKPRVKLDGDSVTLEEEPKENVVIACLRRNLAEIPMWPDKCVSEGEENPAALILNNTIENATVLIAFPEIGTWYATFKLFYNNSESDDCICSDDCKENYSKCTEKCKEDCGNERYCDNCFYNCELEVLGTEECASCRCGSSDKATNTSVIFDVHSYPCIGGKCGDHGRCMYMVSQGVVFSTCVCSNNFRGWNCIDDSNTNSYGMILLELLLLVLSNLAFLPAVYLAYKRKYFVEAVVYCSTFFFSTFYHACDAGENIYSFCITRVGVLQFGDFYCALLSIWVTLIAIADLESVWPAILHMLAAILLAFGTTLDKLSLWVFVIPSVIGVVIIVGMWYMRYRKCRYLSINRRYLYIKFPLGVAIVTVALIMYAALQTQSNYKYIHSLWHIGMAAAVMLLLPGRHTFLVEPLL